jgi:hypothetical protein
LFRRPNNSAISIKFGQLFGKPVQVIAKVMRSESCDDFFESLVLGGMRRKGKWTGKEAVKPQETEECEWPKPTPKDGLEKSEIQQK